uniref:Uncharacterized protein n=1 Tax=Oryza glumipatula TaxID=40148 RepID=A0A0E0AB47_9ORYZ
MEPIREGEGPLRRRAALHRLLEEQHGGGHRRREANYKQRSSTRREAVRRGHRRKRERAVEMGQEAFVPHVFAACDMPLLSRVFDSLYDKRTRSIDPIRVCFERFLLSCMEATVVLSHCNVRPLILVVAVTKKDDH